MADNEISAPGVTNKYAQDFIVPPEFSDILRDLTREILRSQPKDINKFGKTTVNLAEFHFEISTL